MKKRKWTQEQIDKLTEMIHAGATNREIATAVGTTIEAVQHRRSHMGLTIAKVQAAADAKAKAATPKKKAMPKAKIAAAAAPRTEKPEQKSSPTNIKTEKTYTFDRSISLPLGSVVQALRACSDERREFESKCVKCPLTAIHGCNTVLAGLALRIINDKD